MNSTDPIADMLARIRNGAAVGKQIVHVPHSGAKEKIAKILVDRGFLYDCKKIKAEKSFILELGLSAGSHPASITEINRLSRPGRRLYVGSKDIPVVKRGRGIVVISTPSGMMTGDQAKSKKLGGELICQVY